ncbi:MAG TPA: PD-(D/E)XK nuclease family protein, partial [Candidatus Kapabacteria bacterium]|nr:PD-(D/E)XK nuclease family protein [Candidatus Kapabacteria bacterium]
YIYHFYTLLSRLSDSLRNTDLILSDIRTFRQLFIDIVKNSRIPFTGEPLEGLQIMGMLETQTLDFNHLYVLSVNEGFLPPGKAHQSFIPFDVRDKLGLPTYRDRDAIAAYHFYRLLKSSQNITLIYNTEAKGIEKSEKSRFIDQLLIEYAERNKNAIIKHQVIDFTFDAQQVKAISIRKSQKMIELLARKSYSPSSLLVFLTCPVKFYFNYILKLREEEEVYESPEYYQVGHIVHQALYELYKPYCGKNKPVGGQEIEAIKEKIEPKLQEAYSRELKSGDIHTGRNRIAYEVMKQFLENFFDKEKQESGFTILMLEKKVEGVDFRFSTGAGIEYRVMLEGTIDRVDIKDDVHRVIDYKTGKINPLNLKSLEELSGPGVIDRREAFQLFFYRYLLRHTLKDSGPYRLGIYPFKKMYDELKFIKVDKCDLIDEGMLAQFEDILRNIFRRLFDLAEPFVQTREEKNCRYCPYQDICGRDA